MAATAIDALREQVRDLTEAVRNLERWAKTLEPEKPRNFIIWMQGQGVFTMFNGFVPLNYCNLHQCALFETEDAANTVRELLFGDRSDVYVRKYNA